MLVTTFVAVYAAAPVAGPVIAAFIGATRAGAIAGTTAGATIARSSIFLMDVPLNQPCNFIGHHQQSHFGRIILLRKAAPPVFRWLDFT